MFLNLRSSFIVLFSMVLAWSSVQADTLALTWTQPTTRVDGTPMPLSEIAHYRVSWTVKGVAQPDKVAPVGTTYTLDTGTLVGRTCVTLYTVDTDGLESGPSNTGCRNARPNPPTNLVVK